MHQDDLLAKQGGSYGPQRFWKHLLQEYPYEKIIQVLAPHLTDERKLRIRQVIEKRTTNVCMVLDHLYDAGNISAIIRSAESFGQQELHFVSSDKNKTSDRTTSGAHKWMDIYRWESTQLLLGHLKNSGYKIYVTSMKKDAKNIFELDLPKKMAIVMGNEQTGCTEEAINAADDFLFIPTVGLTQSFNVSVAAGIILSHVYHKRSLAMGQEGDLEEASKQRLMAQFYVRSFKLETVRAILKRAL